MYIDPNNKDAIYEQIVFNIKKDILQGILSPEDKILSVREMSKKLGVNPNTVAKAYKELEYQNVIVTIKGRGSFIKRFEESDTEIDIQTQKKLKKELQSWLVEARYAKIPKDIIYEWIKEEEY
ncbi:Transcriptional regulator GntR family [Lactococcus cremoris]|uniref:Transcriptional regulator GntR family n=1 Tax=Lactococcus lactis subsp. cremoris TaxID=1359 RepID=A0A170MYR3_LACLC|nr:GntR family transcriptional regulator [Lactococcus cremoris]KZK07352.1 Transcriptional regulator GntR family [Lactococcus cremoris]